MLLLERKIFLCKLLMKNKTESQAFQLKWTIWESTRLVLPQGRLLGPSPGLGERGEELETATSPGLDLPSHGGESQGGGWVLLGLKLGSAWERSEGSRSTGHHHTSEEAVCVGGGR